MKLKRIAVIGCGGINSLTIMHLHKLVEDFDKQELIYVKVFDKDIIEEKNLLRQNQNFQIEDLMQPKANVLAKRYNFDSENIFITEDNIDLLKNFDDIILGVDNNKVRQLIYKFAIENNKYLLDMRAQGTQMQYIVIQHGKNMDYYNKKYFNNKDIMERKGSCQLDSDIENDHIENANRIISYFGIYGIYFKHLRGEEISSYEWKFVY